MKPKKKNDNRKFKRVSIMQDLNFGKQELRPLESVSEDGMFIPTPDVFMENSVLDLKFKLHNQRKQIVVKAKVRHAIVGVGMGVQFVNLKPEDRRRIRRFIKGMS